MTRDDLKFPIGTWFVMSAKLGRFASATIAALVPGHEEVFFVEEVPNYHYVGNGEIELLSPPLTTTQWAQKVIEAWAFYAPERRAVAIISEDSTFDKALKRTKLSFVRNLRRKPETRTEISREFFEMRRVFIAPWLSVLPHELQKAKWPPEASGKGAERIEGQDYTLHTLEHILSRRPRPKKVKQARRTTFVERLIHEAKRGRPERRLDGHMGSQ